MRHQHHLGLRLCLPMQGHAVEVAFFVEGGVRSCKNGKPMFGEKDPIIGDKWRPAGGHELCRMAIPRRVYTQVKIGSMAPTSDAGSPTLPCS